MKSIVSMYEDHVVNGPLSYLLGYKFSQDHLETTFSVIRSKGGFNNNPNCLQFKTAFKRLLMRNQLMSSLNANCLNNDETFMHLKKITEDMANNSVVKDVQFYNDVIDVWEDAFDECNTFQLSEYNLDVVSYIAGFVEKTAKKKLKCVHCINAISKKDVDESKLIKIKNLGGLIIPQIDIVKVCETAELILWSTDIKQTNLQQIIRAYNETVCREINFS